MAGKIRTREKCPQCGKAFKLIEETDIYCPSCNTRPKTFFIFLYWKGDKFRISRDRDGQMLDSHRRAHRLLENIRADIDTHKFNPRNYLTSELAKLRGSHLLSRWITNKEHSGVSGWHLYKLNQYMQKYFQPFFGHRDMRDILRHDIDEFLNWLPSHLSLKTKKNIMGALRNFTRWLYQVEILNRTIPFPDIKPDEPVIKWTTKEMQLKYLQSIPEEHRPIFSFLLNHPVRVGEACALQRKHFDLHNMVVEISQAVGFKYEIKARKNRRPYFLPVSSRFDVSILKNKLPDAYVFTHSGKLYNYNVLGSIWRTSLKKADLPYLNLYNASRHSIASQAVNSGVSLDRISKALGHSSIEMTKKYASMNVELLRDIVEGEQGIGAQMVQMEPKNHLKS
jgi:integrase